MFFFNIFSNITFSKKVTKNQGNRNQNFPVPAAQSRPGPLPDIACFRAGAQRIWDVMIFFCRTLHSPGYLSLVVSQSLRPQLLS